MPCTSSALSQRPVLGKESSSPLSWRSKQDVDREPDGSYAFQIGGSIEYTVLATSKARRDSTLVLQPLSCQDPIRCTITHAKLEDDIRYEALSYVWGSGESTKIIEINDFELAIRTNLWEALRYLAPARGTRVLWIDAICINQESDAERNHQVAQMGRIYSSAKTVVVWLGSPTKESHALFQLLSNPYQWAELQKLPGLLEQSLENLVLLCQREYWTRL